MVRILTQQMYPDTIISFLTLYQGNVLGDTPLHILLKAYSEEQSYNQYDNEMVLAELERCIKLFLDCNADLSIENQDEETAKSIASSIRSLPSDLKAKLK